MVEDTIKENKSMNEHYGEDEYNDDDYDEDSFGKFDPDYFKDSEEGFSSKMHTKNLHKKMKLGDTNISRGHHIIRDKKNDRENEKRKYAGLDPLRNDTQPTPYSPIKSDDLPLDKYLEKRKMKDLDEDIAMLDNLFTKD
jgi:hypothetical protein